MNTKVSGSGGQATFPQFINMTHLKSDDPVIDELDHIGQAGNGTHGAHGQGNAGGSMRGYGQ